MRRKCCLLMWCILAAACFPGASGGAEQANPPEAGRLQCWVDLYRGEPLPFEAVLGDLAGARVVYVGERHALARHQAIQEAIVRGLAERDVPLVLAMEQVEVIYQPQLDQYNRGEIDFDRLAELMDWKSRWSGHESYRGVVEAARKAGAPVLALNARRETIRQVARSGGVEKLDEARRKELPKEIWLDDPAYERLLNLSLQVHAMAMPGRLRPMIEAQMARDEQMAATLSAFLDSKQGRGRTAVVLCGAMHCSHGMGTVARVRRRMPDVKDRIILMSESGDVKLSPAMQAMARPIHVTHEQLREVQQPIADYLHIISRKAVSDSK